MLVAIAITLAGAQLSWTDTSAASGQVASWIVQHWKMSGILVGISFLFGSIFLFTYLRFSLERWRRKFREAESSREKIKAIKKLGQLGKRDEIETSLECLSDENAAVRQTAREALDKLGATERQLVDGYLQALRLGNTDCREEALEFFGELRDKQSVIQSVLLELLDSKSEYRQAAREALDQLGVTSQ